MRIRWFLATLSVLGLSCSGVSGQEMARVAAVPTHTIGLDEDSVFFDRISGVVALPGGELVVAEMRVSQVRLINPASLTTSLVGGAGGGPGEFRFPAEVGRLPGRFWVYDLGSMRMTVFDDSGRVEQTFRTRPLTGATSLLSGGVIVGIRRMPADPKQEARWLVLFDAEHDVARDSIPLEQPRRQLHLQIGTTNINSLQYWSDHTLWEPAPDGSGVVVVERPTSGPPEIVVRWYDSTGGLQSTVRVAYEPERITNDNVRRLAEAISGTILDAQNRLSSAIDRRDFSPSAIEEHLHVPDRLPPVSAITVGEEVVYLRRGLADLDAHRVEYWIVDRSGL